MHDIYCNSIIIQYSTQEPLPEQHCVLVFEATCQIKTLSCPLVTAIN